jgi:hypothetical protein
MSKEEFISMLEKIKKGCEVWVETIKKTKC